MKNLGYYDRAVDGILGSHTKAALLLFQHDRGLRCSGEWDAATQNALRQGHEKHVALFYGLVDEERQQLRCANAGCFPWPLLLQGGKALPLELPGMPLGLMTTADYEERAYELTSDSTFVACTDGVFEVMGSGTVDEKSQRIAEAAVLAGSAAELVRALNLGANPKRPDDVAVMMLKRGGTDALRTS